MPGKQRNFYAVLPAAGRSRRMGAAHKLMLPWRNSTVIASVLQQWAQSKATSLFVVIRADDIELQSECRKVDRCELILPDVAPADMKESIQVAVRYIEQNYHPSSADRCLIAPADLPTLTTSIIDRVIVAGQSSDCIVAPLFGDRSGHPICLPWEETPRLFQLAPDQGVNQLMMSGPVEMFSLPGGLRPEDIDTPEDYQRLRSMDLSR